MLKQICTYLGYSGTFAKLNHTLYLLRASGVIRLHQQRHCDANNAKRTFSTSTESKSKQPLFDKEELAEWSDWLSDNRRSHVTKKDHVTRQTGDHGNKALHVPVMVGEVKNIFDEIKPKTILDMTFGAGGHTKALLDQFPDCKILALDRDPYAYQLAQDLAEERPGRVIPLLGRFSDLPTVLHEINQSAGSIDGALFDLGSSSMQFDQSERGFSLSRNGPLDMRMDGDRVPGQPTAADVINILDESELAKILHKYGDEKKAKKIAHSIVNARSAFGKITTTHQLADIVSGIFPGAYTRDSLNRHAHIATKTFQALRIFVNNELNELHNGLELVNQYLRPGGICIVISFHSLEDRIVKRLYHDIDMDLESNISIQQRHRLSNPPAIFTKEEIAEFMKRTKWDPLKKSIIVPTENEVQSNARSRSARLRAAYRVVHDK